MSLSDAAFGKVDFFRSKAIGGERPGR
jgi:hypothetical protein